MNRYVARSYYYRTPVGTFWIRPQSDEPGRVVLGVNDRPLRSYNSPDSAADDFSRQQTGWSPWDRLDHPVVPNGVSQWQRGDPSR